MKEKESYQIPEKLRKYIASDYIDFMFLSNYNFYKKSYFIGTKFYLIISNMFITRILSWSEFSDNVIVNKGYVVLTLKRIKIISLNIARKWTHENEIIYIHCPGEEYAIKKICENRIKKQIL